MKSILITDKVYDQLKTIAEDQDEMIEVVACLYLGRGMGEIKRLDEKIEAIKANTQFYEAALKCPHLTTKRH